MVETLFCLIEVMGRSLVFKIHEKFAVQLPINKLLCCLNANNMQNLICASSLAFLVISWQWNSGFQINNIHNVYYKNKGFKIIEVNHMFNPVTDWGKGVYIIIIYMPHEIQIDVYFIGL